MRESISRKPSGRIRSPSLRRGPSTRSGCAYFPSGISTTSNSQSFPPFAGEPGRYDFGTPNVKLFQRLDEAVARLRGLKIQADIILFHPYDADNWGFSYMSRVQDEKYIRYVTARLGAFSNVWWSAANEYNLFRSGYKAKKSGWQRILSCIRENDPYPAATVIR